MSDFFGKITSVSCQNPETVVSTPQIEIEKVTPAFSIKIDPLTINLTPQPRQPRIEKIVDEASSSALGLIIPSVKQDHAINVTVKRKRKKDETGNSALYDDLLAVAHSNTVEMPIGTECTCEMICGDLWHLAHKDTHKFFGRLISDMVKKGLLPLIFTKKTSRNWAQYRRI